VLDSSYNTSSTSGLLDIARTIGARAVAVAIRAAPRLTSVESVAEEEVKDAAVVVVVDVATKSTPLLPRVEERMGAPRTAYPLPVVKMAERAVLSCVTCWIWTLSVSVDSASTVYSTTTEPSYTATTLIRDAWMPSAEATRSANLEVPPSA